MLEFRAEFFNILNHTNFSGDHLSTTVFDGTPGDIGPVLGTHKPECRPGHKTVGRITNGRSSLR